MVIESAQIISPLQRKATSIARLVFPLAVWPTITMSGLGVEFLFMPFEEFFQFSELNLLFLVFQPYADFAGSYILRSYDQRDWYLES